MKFRKKIAQTATEYLIILAVVIIIALIVVGVLGGIPGIGGSSSSNVANAYWQTATIGVDGYKMSYAGNDSIRLKNNNAVDIDIINVTIGSTLIYNGTGEGSITILKGRTKEISAAAGYTMVNNDFVTCGLAGDAFSELVTIIYEDKKTDSRYTLVSDQNLEGECAA